jgi:adenylyltransferase/sulfurtransferase
MKKEKKWGDEVYSLLSWFSKDKVNQAKAMVIGGGALGNEVVKNLALFGVGTIVIVDYDTIEYSNLTRSILFRESDADKGLYKADVLVKKVKEINPEVNAIAICGNLKTEVGLGIYREMDVIFGCLDSRLARFQLNRLCFRANKPWIDGGIENLEGTVRVFIPEVNCYECSLSKAALAEINARMPCANVVKRNEKAGRIATTPVIASIIGAIQVQEALKLIHQEQIDKGNLTSLGGNMLHYDGAHNQVDLYDFTSYKKNCLSHEQWKDIIPIPELSADTTIREALDLIAKHLDVEEIEINLRNDKFVSKIVSSVTNTTFEPMRPESKIADYVAHNNEIRDLQIVEGLLQREFENIDAEFPFLHLTLKEIGIPYYDILQVSTADNIFYVELTADKKKFNFLS